MEKHIADLLSTTLGVELSEDLAKYIVSIEDTKDFDDYMKGILDVSNKEQKSVFDKIQSAKFGNRFKSQGKNKQVNNAHSLSPSPTKGLVEETESSDSSGKKKSKKFKKFQLSEIHQGYLREGRIPCDCQATKHKLINNCLECGRIVCEQEGSGPCFFCDNMVCTPEEEEVLRSNTKQADALYRTLNDRKKSETWKKALQNRNKLLEFDKNNVKQTKIIDDEHDYFEINNRWNSKKDREKAAKRLEKEHEFKHGSRLGSRKITFDLVGKQALEDKTYSYQDDEEEELSSQNGTNDTRRSYESAILDIDSVLEHLRLEKTIHKSIKEGIIDENLTDNQKLQKNYIIQDKGYLEMLDKGMCLSMHQPWASLLVLGIKKYKLNTHSSRHESIHEGRTWYTPHRGTLWIASTTKIPEPETIQEVENFYKKYYEGMTIKFPSNYPTGSLLGNVLLQDCLSQDEYRQEFPNGESDSPVVFICSDPNKLVVPIPVKGDHKIWKLKSDIHVMARDALILKKRFAK